MSVDFCRVALSPLRACPVLSDAPFHLVTEASGEGVGNPGQSTPGQRGYITNLGHVFGRIAKVFVPHHFIVKIEKLKEVDSESLYTRYLGSPVNILL